MKLIIKYFSYIILIFSINWLSACQYTKNVNLLLANRLARENFTDSIPFELRKGIIVVRAKINGDSVWREFIFDTGAFNSKIEKRQAQELQLPTKAHKTNSDTHGNQRVIEVTQIRKLRLGNTDFENISAGKVEYNSLSASPCLAKAGIIGANLIQLANWKIDFQEKYIYFSDKPLEINLLKQKYTFDFQTPVLSGKPIFAIRLDNKIIQNMVFDTGSNSGFVLPHETYVYFPKKVKKLVFDQSITGIYGTKIDTLIYQNRIWDDIKIEVPVVFSKNGKGLLGTEILRFFDVFLDYEAKQIHLQANSEKNIQIPENLNFIPKIMNDSLWVVARTSPEYSFKLGDTLRTINGKKPNDLFSDYCDYLMNIRHILGQDSIWVETFTGHKIRIKI